MTTPGDDERTWAGNQPLDQRWWWSPALMIVVGVVVIAFQVSAYTGDGGTWLNAVMIAVGAAVVVAGLFSLRKAHRTKDAPPQGTAPPPES
ncbi:hypothetical protein ICW40_09735 [Actinotalea ferrariae]|uniref:hypothetical protein n=1 Tax=Actinotalea ferrariae TaxID=1386098 RepID=UPI001C8BA5E4|nr:hypothetical protein [Actinotalea ferrariae]MBX9245085.1 hypothetical protein [Actinotalea ferrariae]